MALIKIQGKTILEGKTIFSGGPSAASAAEAYIAAVEAADGESLEAGVQTACTNFIAGLWADGLWDSLKASCILAGARTLSGALVPLTGTAPTNNNFVSGDYNRETGLKGNASTKYLDTNRAESADPQNDAHIAVNLTQHVGTANRFIMGALSNVAPTGVTRITDNYSFNLRGNGVTVAANATPTFLGASRASASSISYRAFASTSTAAITSTTTCDLTHYLFTKNKNGSMIGPIAHRISFYSLGESIDLALLETRVSTLMTDIANAI